MLSLPWVAIFYATIVGHTDCLVGWPLHAVDVSDATTRRLFVILTPANTHFYAWSLSRKSANDITLTHTTQTHTRTGNFLMQTSSTSAFRPQAVLIPCIIPCFFNLGNIASQLNVDDDSMLPASFLLHRHNHQEAFGKEVQPEYAT